MIQVVRVRPDTNSKLLLRFFAFLEFFCMVFGRIVLTCRQYFSEYAPTALRNKWKPAATIKLIHYRRLGAKPHESSASGGYLGIQCLQRFQSLDAARASPPGVRQPASPCPSFSPITATQMCSC